ncbi:hypothetical protein [Clostridium botulinum]|nr:hypothetical protein [Clostridium botulinum]
MVKLVILCLGVSHMKKVKVTLKTGEIVIGDEFDQNNYIKLK